MTKPHSLSPLAQIAHDVIDGKRAEIRLYPDLYSEEIAIRITAQGYLQTPALELSHDERTAALADAVERRLDAETHDDLCACATYPTRCATYGTAVPWSHTDVHKIVSYTEQAATAPLLALLDEIRGSIASSDAAVDMGYDTDRSSTISAIETLLERAEKLDPRFAPRMDQV